MDATAFDLDAGALCLDFINTLEWRSSDQPKDRLEDYTHLIGWGVIAGALPPEYSEQLHRLAKSHPEVAEGIFDQAIQLREVTYRIFASHLDGGSSDHEDIDILNQYLSRSTSKLQLVPSSGGYSWQWSNHPDELDQMLWPVARSAGELLVSEQLGRVRQCADDRGCGYLFIDTSRNRSRRWCSMETCGNRAKARRHYDRQRQVQA